MTYHLPDRDYWAALAEAFEIANMRSMAPISVSHVAAMARRIEELEAKTLRSGSCPCEWVTPCRSTCSCATPIMSGGCSRCCKYGSDLQRMAAALDLAVRLGKCP